MKCENCNSTIKKGDVFCSECGKNLNKKKYFKNLNNTLIKHKTKIFYTLLIIILVCLLFSFIGYITSPIHVAQSYMKSIVNNDYEKIYKLSGLVNSDLVSESVLKKKTEKLETDEYRLEAVDYYNDRAVVTYIYNKNNKTYRAAVLLKKSINKQFLFFDEWKIMSSKVANDVTIEVPTGSKVLIDDVDIKDYLYESQNDLDIYIIDQMVAGEYKIKVNINGLVIEDTIDIQTDKRFTIGNIDLTDELEKDILEKVNTVLNPLYTNSINSTNYSETGLTNLKNTYKNLKTNIQNKIYTLKNINFKSIEYISATYEKTNLIAGFDVTYDYTVDYNVAGEVKTYSGTSTSRIYVSFKYNNETYVISEISYLPTNFKIRN